MKECMLCERDMKGDKNFGKSCFKKACNILGIHKVKNEQELSAIVLKLCNKRKLSNEQVMLLVDRYLTLNILNKVPITAYDKYKRAVKDDIELINKKTEKDDLKSFSMVTLKQAVTVNKIYEKYKKVFDKIMSGEYDVIQNISFDLVRFAFSKYYSKKSYLYGELQILQYAVFKSGVEFFGKFLHCDLLAKLLDHSLEEKSEDLLLTDDAYKNKLIVNEEFRKKITDIVEKYGENSRFDTGEEKETIVFEEFDLKASLHNANIRVIGSKNNNSKWDLEIILMDRYDFTDLKELQEYMSTESAYKKKMEEFVLAFANNLAMFAVSCNVIHEYNVTIKFSINDWSGWYE